ncbi:MAG: hypothetical protein IRZ07_05630 [Microbispora sp.]|nr:hypothetical protein [Microbispora sp.]
MPINAQEIVQAIGEGVAEALRTNRLFLGVEEDAFRNADIHPEYVTTVEVAKKLTGPDRIVSLETHMKELRRHARWLALVHAKSDKAALPRINGTLAGYRFGKKDSQRIDILVRSSDNESAPLLVAEAKLGVQNLPGVLRDIDRIARLLSMYSDLNLLGRQDIYGAVLFHLMEEGEDVDAHTQKAQNLLTGIDAHLNSLRSTKTWMNARAGLLTHGAKTQPATGYRETHDDGTEESVFAKESFTFAPGLILLGNAADVNSAKF